MDLVEKSGTGRTESTTEQGKCDLCLFRAFTMEGESGCEMSRGWGKELCHPDRTRSTAAVGASSEGRQLVASFFKIGLFVQPEYTFESAADDPCGRGEEARRSSSSSFNLGGVKTYATSFPLVSGKAGEGHRGRHYGCAL